MYQLVNQSTTNHVIMNIGKPASQVSLIQDKDNKKVIGENDGSSERGAHRKGGSADPSLLALAVPKLSVCADAQKVDRAKLAQTEVMR